ncbi:universal stress protein [Roseicyclus persicicus]|uniref:Universal stress protein n=1 Tax=Roseicyclus persicicus TaxID=2650661 RepID=A0A7X6GZV8_9RHOB|nr:universal stress protein [Roseibacterium persicicum]NKX45441.1 universal stress protein [Roseibacterium persicicum]
MTDRILVATDGSEAAARAVACAADLSGRLGRGLSIVHVQLHGRPLAELARLADVEHLLDQMAARERFRPRPAGPGPDPVEDDEADEIARTTVVAVIGEQILARARSDAEDAGAIDIRTEACAGDTADEILDMAEAEGAGMIVLGRRGLGRLRELVLGSVTQKVLHATDATVVVVS